MNPEFEECLKKGRIKKFSRGKSLVEKELKTARSDFERARFCLTTIHNLYTIVHK